MQQNDSTSQAILITREKNASYHAGSAKLGCFHCGGSITRQGSDFSKSATLFPHWGQWCCLFQRQSIEGQRKQKPSINGIMQATTAATPGFDLFHIHKKKYISQTKKM